MELKIHYNACSEKECSVIYIIHEVNELALLKITNEEKEYTRKRFSKGKRVIAINKLTSVTIIILVLKDEVTWSVLEKTRIKAHTAFTLLENFSVENILISTIADNIYNYAFIEGLLLSHYQFVKYFKKPNKRKLKNVHIEGTVDKNHINSIANICKGVYIARDFVNEPVCELNAPEFANRIKKHCEEAGCKVSVKGKDWIKLERMGGLLAVNKGSIDPPRFVMIEWLPLGMENEQPVVVVGKGIVFDTGGLSLKTSQYMETMKSDMGGAAAVAGLMYALAKNKVQKNVVALIPSTDNRPDGNAYVPGDIVKMRNGLFVEVLNTDAEGRMILADALDYANNYNPKLVIDIATLTGAANLALGEHGVVTMGTANDELFQKLEQSGYNMCERVVRFPFWDEYEDLIKSEVADIKNVGGPIAGSITAGKFLAHFVKKEWIHLDISGSAFVKKSLGYKGNGATGFGVRLLYNFIECL